MQITQAFQPFHSTGILHYEVEPLLKLVALIDPEITRYYRALLPKSVVLNPQRYASHISIVRKEVPPKMEHWGKYQGEEVEFAYDGYVFAGTPYWWINVYSSRLEDIRVELGLPNSSQYTRPPEGYSKCFHSTIGNSKGYGGA